VPRHAGPRSLRARVSAGALVAGLALAGGAALGLAGDDPATTFAVAPPPPVSVAAASAPDAPGGGRPLRVSLPGLGVDAVVQDVVTVAGALQVPEDPQQVGWWTGSAPPGSAAGATVLDGHVDSARRGRGAFWHLRDLEAGDQVTVTSTTALTTYRVYAREVLDKGEPLPPELFTREGAPHLVLITCGGPFDARTRAYRDNVVVSAAPVAAEALPAGADA
jgi:LPXTG-site transpeptidase (sortase) family protein